MSWSENMSKNQEFIINRDMMPGNDCFGCGLENPDSMGVKLFDRTDGIEGLMGSFKAPEHATAFPNIVHPGAFFTGMVCLSVWTPYRLRSDTKAVWFLTDSKLSFCKAAMLHDEHQLRSSFVEEKGQWDPLTIGVEALDQGGDTLITGQFTIHPFPPELAMEIAGVTEIPESWQKFLDHKC